MNPFTFLWLVPVFPLVGALVVGLFGKKLPKGVISVLAPATVGMSFVMAAVLAGALWFGWFGGVEGIADGEPQGSLSVGQVGGGVEQEIWSWIPSGGGGSVVVPLGFRWDGLSAWMVLVVTFVAFWIHVYSVGYMGEDSGYARFFSYMNLFVFFMLTLVLGSSFPVMFIGWEGVGLCSYLLIGYYYEEKWPQDASVKAFITNRIGDLGFLLAMLWLFAEFGTLHFVTVFDAVGHSGSYAGSGMAAGVALLLFLGATGKSAQLPLYVWLPDAMAGPTPVSALIHAATMVTAGVYMVVRCAALYVAAPGALMVVGIVGAATAIFAATMGLTAVDLKKVLAYSTVSQLGYMFLALGVGSFVGGIFHLTTHAFFKALLFLASGSVMHAMGGELDARKMGALRAKMPHTWRTFLIGSLAIAGIFPLAGFWSKDEILYGAWSSGGAMGKVLWGLGLVGALMTAFYMFRLVSMTFLGEKRWGEGTHPHESPRVMTVPLWVLAIGAILVGLVGLPVGVFGKGRHLLERALAPALPHVEHAGHAVEGHGGHHLATEIGLMVVSLCVALVGIWWAWTWYHKRGGEPAARLAARAPWLYRALWNRWWVDEIYWGLVLHPYRRACNWLRGFDEWAVDGVINGSALAYRGGSSVAHWFDLIVVDGLVNLLGWVSKGFAWLTRRVQTGVVGNYLYFIVAGLFVLLGIYVFLVVL